MDSLVIRTIIKSDWEAVKSIYEKGISTGIATFQLVPPTWEEWNDAHLKTCRIIAIRNNSVLGWTALTPVSKREVYKGVAEVSLYINEGFRGQGIGQILLEKLIQKSEGNGIWTLQSSIFPQNIPSIKVHEKLGFKTVGTREKIGQRNGIWYDNLLLERRSTII